MILVVEESDVDQGEDHQDYAEAVPIFSHFFPPRWMSLRGKRGEGSTRRQEQRLLRRGERSSQRQESAGND